MQSPRILHPHCGTSFQEYYHQTLKASPSKPVLRTARSHLATRYPNRKLTLDSKRIPGKISNFDAGYPEQKDILQHSQTGNRQKSNLQLAARSLSFSNLCSGERDKGGLIQGNVKLLKKLRSVTNNDCQADKSRGMFDGNCQIDYYELRVPRKCSHTKSKLELKNSRLEKVKPDAYQQSYRKRSKVQIRISSEFNCYLIDLKSYKSKQNSDSKCKHSKPSSRHRNRVSLQKVSQQQIRKTRCQSVTVSTSTKDLQQWSTPKKNEEADKSIVTHEDQVRKIYLAENEQGLIGQYARNAQQQVKPLLSPESLLAEVEYLRNLALRLFNEKQVLRLQLAQGPEQPK